MKVKQRVTSLLWLYLYMLKHFSTRDILFPILLFFQGQATPDVPTIMEALFQCTLEMLNKDLEEFPEHRLLFFRMLQSFTTHCFPGILIIVNIYTHVYVHGGIISVCGNTLL